MDKEAMAAILHGQESVKTLKMITAGSDPTVAAHLDNILHSFSLLSILIDSFKSKSTAKQSLNKKSSGEEEEEDRVFHTVDSPTPIHEDGFLGRKYGQKTIKGSPYQRNYYKCVNSKNPNCHAKKQVQKIQDNPSLFRTTYIGQHMCQTPIKLYPTNDNTNNKLDDSISFGIDNSIVDDDFSPLLNVENFWSDELSYPTNGYTF